MKHIKFFILNIFIVLFFIPVARGGNPPYGFLPHEEVKLEVFYNWSFLWVHAGNAYLKADTTTYNGVKSVRFTADGYSVKKWDFIFKLEDHYTAIAQIKPFRPLFYEKSTMEGGYWIHNIYRFDWKEKRIKVFTESKRRPVVDTVYTLKKPLFDVLSATYYLRTLNSDTLSIGDIIPVPLITDGQFVTYNISYDGTGVLQRHNKKIVCNVFTAIVSKSTFFSADNPLKIYVSRDPGNFIIYAEAHIVVGSIKVYQEGYKYYKPLRVRK